MPNEIESYEYQLIKPYTIIKVSRKITASEGECLLRPVTAGICGSDVLYFKGDKDPQKLQQRLPLVPLHEGVVRNIDTDELGCIIPYQKCNKCYSCLNGMENLCESSLYMGSNAPGLSRNPFSYPKELILNHPPDIPMGIVSILEPMSIVYKMINEMDISDGDSIGVIGTGLLGSLSIILLSILKGVKKDNLYLFGRSDYKLLKLDKLCKTINIYNTKTESLKSSFSFVIEAVGGHSMTHSLGLAVKLCRPRGKINVFGLAYNMNNINFTNIVNKGLILTGFSRAIHDDYASLLEIINENSTLASSLEMVIDKKEFVINNADDLTDAFHYVMSGNNEGRVIVTFPDEA